MPLCLFVAPCEKVSGHGAVPETCPCACVWRLSESQRPRSSSAHMYLAPRDSCEKASDHRAVPKTCTCACVALPVRKSAATGQRFRRAPGSVPISVRKSVTTEQCFRHAPAPLCVCVASVRKSAAMELRLHHTHMHLALRDSCRESQRSQSSASDMPLRLAVCVCVAPCEKVSGHRAVLQTCPCA